MTARLDRVLVRRPGRPDLGEVTLVAEPGTSTAVVGGDGAGKSTLLRVLVGTVPATSGTVTAPPRERIGYLSAAPGVYGDLTVLENLRFVGTTHRMDRRGLDARVEELLAVTDLHEARDRLGAQLSGGMRQKLAFACAVLHRPALLVMDEPTTGVDPVSRAELWRLVSGALADGTAAVFSTTYVDEASRADRVVVLDAGRPVASGPPDEVRAGLPGRVVRVHGSGADLATWRRGRARHAWVPPGVAAPDDADPVDPDLEDAVVVVALAAHREMAA